MTYNSGTATSYIDLLDQLVEVVTGRHLATLAVAGGGTGHAVGDIIEIDATGATSTIVAQIEVLTLSGSAIATARIFRGGVYTVDPTNIAPNSQSGSSGSGTGATFTISFAATGWTQLARESVAVSAVVAVGGTGYTNGATDVLTLIGGVVAEGGSAATFTATVSGNIVTSVALLSAGDYEVMPSNAVLTSVAPTGGTGCTLTVTWADKTGDTMIVLQGDGGSSTDPLVGIKTYSNEEEQAASGAFVSNWALFAFTAWAEGAAMHEQANVTDGFDMGAADGTLTTSETEGHFLPSMPSGTGFTLAWWISATGRRVHIMTRTEDAIGTDYPQASFGLLNPYGITTELPFPHYVATGSDRKRVWYRTQSGGFSGLSQPLGTFNGTGGPISLWTPEGTWLQFRCGTYTTVLNPLAAYNIGGTQPFTAVWPLGQVNAHGTADDKIWIPAGTTGFDNDDLTLASGAIEIRRTPDTGGDLFPLFPISYAEANTVTVKYRVLGELDGIFFIHDGGAGISSEDRNEQAGEKYTIFQNGTETNGYSFLAMRED